VLELLLARLSDLGVLKAGGRQRTDSTHVLAAVRSVNRLEFLAETLRATLEALAAAVPDWLSARIDAEWVRRYGARMDSYRLPKGDDKRTKMAVQVGTDGFGLLEAIHAADAPVWLREIPAVVIVRTVWIKQYHRTINDGMQEVAWREEKDLPPSRQRICSPYDTDAGYATKRGSGWEGYKVHFSETCDDATETGLPHLVTNVATTDATVTDVERLEQIHTDLNRKCLLPGEHIVDAGYTSAELLVGAQRDFDITPAAHRQLCPGPHRWRFRSRRAHHGLGQPPCHLPARRDQDDLVGMHRTRPLVHRGALPRPGMSDMSRPSTVHTLQPHDRPARTALPRYRQFWPVPG